MLELNWTSIVRDKLWAGGNMDERVLILKDKGENRIGMQTVNGTFPRSESRDGVSNRLGTRIKIYDTLIIRSIQWLSMNGQCDKGVTI
jgi:hypothetical protein